jgi:hypothetical protein
MKTVPEAVGDYLALRRSLGFKLKRHQRFLEEFASFSRTGDHDTERFSASFALGDTTLAHTACRLACPAKRCGFARYRSATDATTEVPPDGLLPYHPRRAKSYLYIRRTD